MEQEPPIEPARGNLDRKHYIGVNATTFYELKGIISTDLPGCSPITLVREKPYIVGMYDFCSNGILEVPIKNTTKKSLIQRYKDCSIDLTRSGSKPILHRLDKYVYENMIE